MASDAVTGAKRGATGMRFVILRLLQHNELGMFHGYRRLGKERAKQRAINFDARVVDRVFPAASDSDRIALSLGYQTDHGPGRKAQSLKRQHKNWRLEGNCPEDHCYDFVEPGCLFAMVVDAGLRPARGAWAVYSEVDPVTVAVKAHAESGQLTRRSMIALHGREGEATLSTLRQATPQLFGFEETSMGRSALQETKKPARGKPREIPPNPKKLVRMLGAVGHTLPSAVADIVDNAISKDATQIDITFGRPDDGHGRWMTIADNGAGMDQDTLSEAMRIGSDTVYDAEDLGKYGYGLKGASWSQTDSFTVVSRQPGKRPVHLSWDTARMDTWEEQDGALEPWVRKVTQVADHGTCVMWRDMRPPRAMPTVRGVDPHTAEQMELERHLALVFHRFIEGKAAGRKKVTIRVAGRVVAPNNPVGHPKTSAYDLKTVRVPTAIKNKDALVKVQAFLLLSEQEVKDFHAGDAEKSRQDLDRLGMYGRRNESQGVYVYRNSRLIQWGGWHDMWATSDEKAKLARVTVDFGSELDEQFDVNISKQKVALSNQLQEEIKKLAKPARDDSKSKYVPLKPRKPSAKKLPGSSGTSTGAAGSTGAKPRVGTPSAGNTQSVPVRPVRTNAFAWKLTSNMTGRPEVQVNERETQLRELLQILAGDSGGMDALTGFLRRLDGAGVQATLLSSPPEQ